jgi:hypothetical protein
MDCLKCSQLGMLVVSPQSYLLVTPSQDSSAHFIGVNLALGQVFLGSMGRENKHQWLGPAGSSICGKDDVTPLIFS